ncbi:hypothetical protein GWI33_004904 [Rhynchophorus ferrugineus]|uniref:Uncharacterized protein n=1 Tax=Rhynchophorus ferrugineus TaxID=354439 RepID=A0A834IMC6_RHYFE|nr:hypothetical protein GWI33_004904 [Rhynchophorus ferrugineus]
MPQNHKKNGRSKIHAAAAAPPSSKQWCGVKQQLTAVSPSNFPTGSFVSTVGREKLMRRRQRRKTDNRKGAGGGRPTVGGGRCGARSGITSL